MIIPDNASMTSLRSKRTDYPNTQAENDAGASGSTDDIVHLSTRNQIIIGVVVGCSVLIAVTTGLIYVTYKKRRWDLIQHHQEEQILSLYHPPPYEPNVDSDISEETRTTSFRSMFLNKFSRAKQKQPMAESCPEVQSERRSSPPPYETETVLLDYDPARNLWYPSRPYRVAG